MAIVWLMITKDVDFDRLTEIELERQLAFREDLKSMSDDEE